MLASLKALVQPFLLQHQDATAKIKRQWHYVLKKRDGTIERHAFFYINTVFNLTNCAAILIRLRRKKTDNTNRDAARERYRNALPGDADFEEAVRRELVRVRCFFCVACLQAHFSPFFQVRGHNDEKYNHSRAAALAWSGDSDEDQEFAGLRRKEKARSEASVLR